MIHTAALLALGLGVFLTDGDISAEEYVSKDIKIDADFPSGNIVVEKIEGDDVYVHQDLRDTKGWWFYWCFRVRGAAGRTLAFHFTNKDVFGARGPAVSLDAGESWAWLGRRRVRGQTFRYSFGDDAADVWFSFGMPYTAANLRAFVRSHSGDPHLKVTKLCESRKGRRVERLHAGRLDGQCVHRVLLTCRHHACEMMANYALEGIIESVLGDRWLRENVEVLAIPFVDKDGAEDGDQGKNRKPRDHNRDYSGKSAHPSVQAIRDFVPEWSEGRLRFAMDMHCPWIRGGLNERIYFVGGEDQENWQEVKRFSKVLEAVRTGPLLYSSRNNLPFGKSWNTAENWAQGMSCSRWAGTLPGIWLATSIEIPYATASREVVTAESARALGGDLARAMQKYLRTGR